MKGNNYNFESKILCDCLHDYSLENQISIDKSQCKLRFTPTTVKLIRAQGECLGTESRRRTRQAAISCGEEQISIDPQISEWGNPAGQYPVILH